MCHWWPNDNADDDDEDQKSDRLVIIKIIITITSLKHANTDRYYIAANCGYTIWYSDQWHDHTHTHSVGWLTMSNSIINKRT